MFIFGGSFNVHRRRLSRFYSISRSQQNVFASGILKLERRCRIGCFILTLILNPSPFDTCWLIPEGSLASSAGSSEYLHVRAVGSFQTSGLQEIPIEQGLPWCLAMDEACWACLERKHALHTHSMLQWRSVVPCIADFFLQAFQQRWEPPWGTEFFHLHCLQLQGKLGLSLPLEGYVGTVTYLKLMDPEKTATTRCFETYIVTSKWTLWTCHHGMRLCIYLYTWNMKHVYRCGHGMPLFLKVGRLWSSCALRNFSARCPGDSLWTSLLGCHLCPFDFDKVSGLFSHLYNLYSWYYVLIEFG